MSTLLASEATPETVGEIVESPAVLTPDDVAALNHDKTYELVDGQLIEKFVSLISSWVSRQVLKRLDPMEEAGKIYIFPVDAGMQSFPGAPNKLRKPDGMVVSAEKLPDGPTSGFMKILPELVLEVVSERDLASEIDVKVVEYQNTGVKVIWVIDPIARTASIYRGKDSAQFIHDDGFLVAPELDPDLKIPLRDVLPKPSITAE